MDLSVYSPMFPTCDWKEACVAVTDGSMVRFPARRRRSCWWWRENMGATWFGPVRVSRETLCCLYAQKRGSLTSWSNARWVIVSPQERPFWLLFLVNFPLNHDVSSIPNAFAILTFTVLSTRRVTWLLRRTSHQTCFVTFCQCMESQTCCVHK